jgi:hypothetical protein
MRGNTGTARLVGVLQEMIQQTASTLDQDWLVLGTIKPDGSLLLDNFKIPYQLGEYLVLDTLEHEVDTLTRVNAVTLTDTRTLTTQPGGGDNHTHGIAAHDHPTVPATLPEASERGRLVGEGDRVLCAWVNNAAQNRVYATSAKAADVVVIGRVYWSG